MTHELKTWKPYFDAVMEGVKTFEIRKADRPFAVGDILRLREYIPVGCTYTGREIDVQVTYLLLNTGPFELLDYVVMAIEIVAAPPVAEHPDTTRLNWLETERFEDFKAAKK